MDFITIDIEALEDTTGGGEGLLGAVRVGLVGVSLLTGNTDIKAPRVEPIRIEQTWQQPRTPVTQR
jgi:hypothetical protein